MAGASCSGPKFGRSCRRDWCRVQSGGFGRNPELEAPATFRMGTRIRSTLSDHVLGHKRPGYSSLSAKSLLRGVPRYAQFLLLSGRPGPGPCCTAGNRRRQRATGSRRGGHTGLASHGAVTEGGGRAGWKPALPVGGIVQAGAPGLRASAQEGLRPVAQGCAIRRCPGFLFRLH